jgi:hypothetical protein
MAAVSANDTVGTYAAKEVTARTANIVSQPIGRTGSTPTTIKILQKM